MKNIALFAMLFLAACGFNAPSVSAQDIPPFPAKSQTAVEAFIQQLITLREELETTTDKFEKENEAAAQNIDPMAVAANYSQNMDAATIQANYERTQEAAANQQRLMALAQKFAAYKDSLENAYNKDFEPFSQQRTNYINHCMGEVGANNNCDALASALNASGDVILEKYYFGKAAAYISYINAYRAEVVPLSILTMNQSLTANEVSMGFKFPHKEDYINLKVKEELIGVILDAFSIDSVLWPL